MLYKVKDSSGDIRLRMIEAKDAQEAAITYCQLERLTAAKIEVVPIFNCPCCANPTDGELSIWRVVEKRRFEAVLAV